MVKKQQKKYGWEFIFIGANIDSYAEAQRLGVRKERAVNYHHDRMGTEKLYAGVSAAVCCTLRSSVADYHMAMDESGWADEINEDYNNRKAGN